MLCENQMIVENDYGKAYFSFLGNRKAFKTQIFPYVNNGDFIEEMHVN